eukprot:5560277-Amphidinium_carterae.1
MERFVYNKVFLQRRELRESSTGPRRFRINNVRLTGFEMISVWLAALQHADFVCKNSRRQLADLVRDGEIIEQVMREVSAPVSGEVTNATTQTKRLQKLLSRKQPPNHSPTLAMEMVTIATPHDKHAIANASKEKLKIVLVTRDGRSNYT